MPQKVKEQYDWSKSRERWDETGLVQCLEGAEPCRVHQNEITFYSKWNERNQRKAGYMERHTMFMDWKNPHGEVVCCPPNCIHLMPFLLKYQPIFVGIGKIIL